MAGHANATHDLPPAMARRWLIRLLAVSGLVKLLLAWAAPLIVDEAYATAVARGYSLSFFDHPPVSFWLSVALADLTGLDNPLIHRLPFLVAGLATIWVMYRIGEIIGGARVGLWSAALYAASPFFMLSGGLLAVPDGTLNLASALTVMFLLRILSRGDDGRLRDWTWVGLSLSLALASKYQAAWLPLAFLLFMILHPRGRRWFVHPGPWLAAGLGLLGLLPVILWNMGNGWASFAFQGGRAGGGVSLSNMALMLVGQALYLLPSGMFVALAGLWVAWRERGRADLALLLLVASGPIVIFNYIYLTSAHPLAHWAMPGWQFALPLGALWLVRGSAVLGRRVARSSVAFAGALWLVLGMFVFQADTGLLTRPFFARPPKWDNTLALFDYRALRSALERRGLWKDADLIMASGWIDGGLIASALGDGRPMRIIPGGAAHHFAYLPGAQARGTALLLRPTLLPETAQAGADMLARARRIDPGAELLRPVILNRGGQPYVAVTVVRLRVKEAARQGI